MLHNLYFAVGIVVVVFIIVGVWAVTRPPAQHVYSGVCAFDLDNTITCGLDNARLAIDFCRANNFKIAINTARVGKYYEDINMDYLGLTEDDMDEFYHGNNYRHSYSDDELFREGVADTKVVHMYTLAEKWRVPPNKVILFDDQPSNITKAKIHGFSTVSANSKNCGLPDDVINHLDTILTL